MYPAVREDKKQGPAEDSKSRTSGDTDPQKKVVLDRPKEACQQHHQAGSGLESTGEEKEGNCLFVGCLTSQQQASVSQGRICSDNFTCCHTEKEVADQTFYLTQSQYTDTRLTSPSADPITPGAWQGSHWSTNF